MLEEFTHASLSKWRSAGKNLDQFSKSLFFDLEKHRNQHSDELVEAIRSSTHGPFEFMHWGRLVDYSLQSTAKILARFKMPRSIASLGRVLHLKPPGLVRTAIGLQRQLLHPYWRAEPAQHELPSNSQIFGRLCVAAGVQAILYPSTRNGGKRCIALFTQNWRQSSAYVELDGPVAPEVRAVRIDGSEA